MNDIFISYSRYDSDKVNELVALLEQEGYSIWIDRDGIESGEDFKRVILKAIKESKVVLFFSSEHSNISDWTAKEIGVAVKYKKHIVPIKLDNSNYNEAVEFDLINLDYIDYSKASIRKAMWGKLLKTLMNKIGNGSKEFERLEAERKAKEEAERARLERERIAKAEAERKAAEAKRRAEQERLERERAEAQRRAGLERANRLKVSNNHQPKPIKAFWIALGAVAAIVLLLVLLLKPKKEPASIDPETQAYQTCQTVEDYRAYLRDYGRNALHYTDAKAFVDKYAADSIQNSLAQQQAEAEMRQEEETYQKCITIAACDSYLNDYPQGRYVAEVQQKKAELEKNAPKNGSHKGHDYVDLGLPSGTLWATCNVGANKPEGYGNYYAWGETAPKNTYNWSTYKYANGDENKLTKYCPKSRYGDNGFTDNLTELQTCDDPATANWGGGWRTPSKAQWDELLANTSDQWTTQDGVKGRLFTSTKNGQTLFLPAAGDRYDSKFQFLGSDGFYWSRTLHTDYYPHLACDILFDSYSWYGGVHREFGFSVRPVFQN